MNHSEISEKNNQTVFLLSSVSVVLAIASLFSLPFPFVRQVWIREVWGLSGLLNALLFLILARRVKQNTFPSLLGALGLVFHEHLLSWKSFSWLAAQGEVPTAYLLFFAGSEVLKLFLIFFLTGSLFGVIRSLRAYYAGKPFQPAEDYSYLVASFLGYALSVGLFFIARSWGDTVRFAAFKTLGAMVSVGAFAGMGLELKNFLKNRQNLFFCVIKIATHGFCLFGILWLLYRRLPIESVILN